MGNAAVLYTLNYETDICFEVKECLKVEECFEVCFEAGIYCLGTGLYSGI